MPRVSVVMPSYNKEKYIAKAIDSILNQSYTDFELIIIDDGSTDKSVDIIRSYQDPRIVFAQNEKNLGIAATRNRALDIAQGEYIALLDADDLTTKERLEREVAFLDQNRNIDVTFGGFLEIDENDNVTERYFSPLKNPKYIKAKLLVQDVIPNGSCMYRREFVDKYEIRYRDGFLGMDDYLFWVECSLYGNISGLPDLFLYWRNTPNNGTNTYRYSEKFINERKEKFAYIQRFALERNGFSLSEEDLKLYCKILSEYKYSMSERQEIESFFDLIKKLCLQAEGKENEHEIKTMFKKQFGLSLEASNVWR